MEGVEISSGRSLQEGVVQTSTTVAQWISARGTATGRQHDDWLLGVLPAFLLIVVVGAENERKSVS